MINDEELFIFNRVVDGDKEAFRFFFEKYYPDLCNLVNIYVHDAVASEEIVQDIFIYLWEKKETIKISSSVKTASLILLTIRARPSPTVQLITGGMIYDS